MSTFKITGIQFEIWKSEDIKKRSVVEVTHGHCFANGVSLSGGPFDSRMGIWRNMYEKCVTCQCTGEQCVGHFGHFTLPEAIVHPLFTKPLTVLLEKHCLHCFKMHLKRGICGNCGLKVGVLKSSGKMCSNCSVQRPLNSHCVHCNALKSTVKVDETGSLKIGGLPVDSILNTKEGIVELLLNIPKAQRYMMSVIPIPPSVIRPPNVTSGKTVRGQSDMTLNIVEIIKISKSLESALERNDLRHALDEIRRMLFEQISVYISNSSSIADHFKKNTANLQGILDRLKGKQGRFRMNLMGKRSNYTARTVVSGDPNIKIGELGVPISVADTLTKPVKITSYNESYWNNVLRTNPGLIKRVEAADGTQINLRYVSTSTIQLEFGHVIYRSLIDGDWVIFNRQPSLHKQSLMAHQIKILPFSSFRMNLSATSPYNADFDGDEMNVHVPQTELATAEIASICAVSTQFISKTSNKPCMGIVQDTLLTAFRATANDSTIDAVVWTTAISCLGWTYLERANEIDRFNNRLQHTGRDLVSLILPEDLFYKHGEVTIEHGMLLTGRLSKRVLGTSSGSLVHILVNDYSGERAATFINQFQLVMQCYMSNNGFSVGLSDCLLSKKAMKLINESNEKTDLEFEKLLNERETLPILQGQSAEDTFEHHANVLLNRNRDRTGRIAVEYTGIENRFTNMTRAGSKGSAINLSQIMACVGQQNVNGKRVQSKLYGRTLPQFEINDRGPDAAGYVRHSYVQGLEPHEFFFHTMAGREGLVDTAIKTAGSGYLQRRLVKAMENIVIEYDYSARDEGRIIQFVFGNDSRDAEGIEFQEVDFLLLKPKAFRKLFVCRGTHNEVVEIKKSIELFEAIDVIRDTNSRFDRKFALAVPIKRLLEKCLRSNTEGEAFTNVTDKFEGVRLHKLHKRWALYPPLYRAFFTASLASKRLVHQYKINALQLTALIHDIKRYWRKAGCHPGECVGAVAAQSVGEPATQLTLNTFHHAGVSAKNATLGIPRLTELVNCSHRPKTPNMVVYFKSPMNTNLHYILDIQNKFAPIPLSRLVDSTSFNFFETAPQYESFSAFPDPQVDHRSGGLFACILIKRSICFELDISIATLVNALYRAFPKTHAASYRIIYPENSHGQHNVIYVGALSQQPTTDTAFTGEIFSHPLYSKLYDTVTGLISNLHIGGMGGIETSAISRNKRKSYQNHILAIDSEWVAYVKGSRILDMCQLKDVDGSRIYSNDIHDMRETFGVEIARNSMKNEIRSVLQFDGSYLNIRHIDLLVDWMTFQGHFVPFTRFGLSQMSDSVLKLASFERVMHFVVNGAIEQTYDDCRGCSERIILGQPVRVGTGAIDCFLDANKCKQAIVKKVTDVWSGPGEMGTPFKDVPEFNWETDTTWTATSEPLIPIFPVKPPPPSYPPPDTRMRFDPPFTSKEAANEEPYRPTSPTDEITAMDEEAYRPTSPTEEPTVMDEDPYRPTSPMDYTD
jgi:DNA-directed RNA polymerase II subunit RPB1